MIRIILTLIIGAIFLLVSQTASAESLNSVLDKAQTAFKNNDYKTALEFYNKAQVEKPNDPKLKYNIANVLYRLNEFSKAIETLKAALGENPDNNLKSKILYNMGNASYKMNKKKEAAGYYLSSINVNPSDIKAKQNYEYVMQQLQEPPRKCKKPKCNKEDKNKDNKKDQNKDKNKDKDKDKKKDQKDKDKNKQDQKDQKDKQDKKDKDKNKDKDQDKKKDKDKDKQQEKQDKQDQQKDGQQNPSQMQQQQARQLEHKNVNQKQAELILNTIREKRIKQSNKNLKGDYPPFNKDW